MADDRKDGLSDGQQMLLWILGLVLVAILFSVFRPDLLRAWQRVAVWHAHTLSDIGEEGLGRVLYKAIGADSNQLDRLGNALASRDATTLNSDLVWKVSEMLGKILRWFLAPALLLLSWDVLQYPKRYRRHFANGATLFKYVQDNFGRHLARAENALKSDLYKGAHAVAKTPWQWMSENTCVKPDETLDEPKALDALRRQLGTPFTSWKALIKGENGWIASEILSYLPSKTDRDGITSYATRGHRYEATVCVSMLLAARRFGVVPVMSFAGLRKTNRALWYALASAGRRVCFVESAGIMAQYEYEMALLNAGKGKHSPAEGRVEAAIAGLKEALEFEVKDEGVMQGDLDVWVSYDPTKS